MLFIGCSCLVLIIVHPHVNRADDYIQSYLILDYVCKGFFILDLVLQLITYGLFQNESSYLRKSKLNWVNIVIIIIEILSFTTLNGYYVFLKI